MNISAAPSVILVIMVLFGMALLATTLGFRRTVYFVSIGYAYAISAMAAAIIIFYRMQLSWLSIAQNLLLIIWGQRLGLFLRSREVKPGYQRQMSESDGQYGRVSLLSKLAIWVGVSVLYTAMVLPALYHTASSPLGNSAGAQVARWAGLVLMIAGLAIEAIADRQKTVFKARFPGTFCNTGLYRWVRCPNYFGEILFWVGSWMMGVFFLNQPAVWIASLAALICLILIMFGSTRRLERSQDKHYGDLPDYQRYILTVPVLFPFLPVYTLTKFPFYLE